MEIYLPGTGILSWGLGIGLVLLTPETSLPNCYPLFVGVGPALSSIAPLLPVRMVAQADIFATSLVASLHNHIKITTKI